MKPIIMSTEDVQAVMDNRKTIARLVAKELDGVDILNCRHVNGDIQEPKGYPIGHVSLTERCKFKPDDVLYVREAWQEVYETEYDIYNPNEPLKITDLIVGFDNLPKKCAGLSREWSCSSMPARNKYYVYAASKPEYTDEKHELKWRPSTQMPREAARLFLRVKDVRVERVQDITEKDAIREGIMYTDFGMNSNMGKLSVDGGKTFHELKPLHYPGYHAGGATNPEQCFCTARSAFSGLWDARNAKHGFGWGSNPFVWVIEFERIPSGAIGPEPDGTAPNGDKGAQE